MNIFVEYWWLIILCLVSYTVGSISFAVIFSKKFKHIDIRTQGSGNAGTTNMLRVFGLKYGMITFVCDCLKGVACCLLANIIASIVSPQHSMTAMYIVGLSAIVGHVFTIFYKAKGGKGFATSIGVMFCVQPILMLCMVLPMLLLLLLFDRMSLLAIVTNIFLALWHWIVLFPAVGIVPCICVTLIATISIFAHRANIVRLLQGKESPISIRAMFFRKK